MANVINLADNKHRNCKDLHGWSMISTILLIYIVIIVTSTPADTPSNFKLWKVNRLVPADSSIFFYLPPQRSIFSSQWICRHESTFWTSVWNDDELSSNPANFFLSFLAGVRDMRWMKTLENQESQKSSTNACKRTVTFVILPVFKFFLLILRV